jgi:hypothetical protein
MRNQFYFQFYVTSEQVAYANALVAHSLVHHPVSNIWDKQEDKKALTATYRFTGSLGEVVFADAYDLPRKQRSFGAIDGQDFGEDFQVLVNEQLRTIDTKSMQRKSNVFFQHYVLNIPASQLHRKENVTDDYFCISFHQQDNQWIASFQGIISKAEILAADIGILYPKGTLRTRKDKTQFPFNEDTYEIDFKDFSSPWLTPKIKAMAGFKVLKLKV